MLQNINTNILSEVNNVFLNYIYLCSNYSSFKQLFKKLKTN